ncbi:hypothetical protein PUNSTDRAFT_131371 [Punctularia strigosozonata HHB-11173 SS5]|uniref:uncharacterized protein n=1 Tax=Punctularia strigosozonata (strain HHB-11173) TaxID=741275 RepID=UPI0004417444|nr:uncharacterized protein PUNSTDRAFT_131371 [Punctularia strigosozonata HHB-11173 SS5]EIN11193.1 hypothetical protein PUNSTDRAFT_131371 [Punctularia strigosozonata HHB-11173 SS5]
MQFKAYFFTLAIAVMTSDMLPTVKAQSLACSDASICKTVCSGVLSTVCLAAGSCETCCQTIAGDVCSAVCSILGTGANATFTSSVFLPNSTTFASSSTLFNNKTSSSFFASSTGH